MPTSSRPVATTLLVLAALPAALDRLHGLGVPHPGQAAHLPPAAALEALALWGLRATAIAGCWWVLASGTLYLGARAVGSGRWQGRLRPLVLPLLRRAVDGAVAVSLLGGAAHAATPLAPPGMSPPVADGVDTAGPVDVPGPSTGHGVVAAEPGWHVVRPGEHLWSIAETTLREGSRSPTLAEVEDYWRRVVDENRARVRSRDPDLIHPGERVRLPGTSGTRTPGQGTP